MPRNVPDIFEAAGLQRTPFTNGVGPLSSPSAFAQHAVPIVTPHVQALVDTAVEAVKPQAVPDTPYTVKRQMPEIKGNNYTAFVAQMDNRPVIVFRRNDSDKHYVVPMERFINPLYWFAVPGLSGRSAQQGSQQSGNSVQQGNQQTGGPTQQGGRESGSPAQQVDQQQRGQQQPMNLFEYMSKLPPNERMLYTLLIYILLSDAISRAFRHGRGGQAQATSQPVSTGWMPGPPKGQQWIIWG